MIAATVEELTPIIGTRPACRAVGAAPATIYRRRRPPEPRPPRPRPTPERALSGPERAQVLDVLHSERFVDVSPEETWATLLDEGTYLCSPRTMYRLNTSRITYRKNHVHFAGPFSLLMSQDHSSFGRWASSSGLAYAG